TCTTGPARRDDNHDRPTKPQRSAHSCPTPPTRPGPSRSVHPRNLYRHNIHEEWSVPAPSASFPLPVRLCIPSVPAIDERQDQDSLKACPCPSRQTLSGHINPNIFLERKREHAVL